MKIPRYNIPAILADYYGRNLSVRAIAAARGHSQPGLHAFLLRRKLITRLDTPQERLDRLYIPEPNSGCWLWIGRIHHQSGYGVFKHEGRTQQAHRVSYVLSGREIPAGLVIDHLCRVRSCVNPAHLEPVTLAENTRRGENACRNKTHCPSGHSYMGTNLRLVRGERHCRRCAALASARYRARKRAA